MRTVFAFPKLSNSGDASRICSVIKLDGDLLTAAKYCINNLVDSVFPEPDSPDTTTAWLLFDKPLYAAEPMANKCLRTKKPQSTYEPINMDYFFVTPH